MRTDPNPGITAAGERTRDQAEISRLHSRAAVLTAQVNQLPDVRQERVAALASAVQNGTYQVSPEQTAGAILSELHARSQIAA
jgi:flagellar biosynthesis anti-sigma factor FlgM